MIPKYYEFSNKVRILSGYRALENIPYELKERGSARPMIITQKDTEEQGIVKTFLSAMSGSGLVIGRLIECTGLLSSEFSEQAAAEFKENGCDSIIAIGGRPSFESGKAVSQALSGENADDILLLSSEYTSKKLPGPFIMVPAANSGLAFNGDPDLIVLDPRMTCRLSPQSAVLSALDILCHAIEAYTCLQKNPVSDAYSFSAINLVGENLAKTVRHPSDRKARHALATAALLSSIAFRNSRPGITHALASALEEIYKLPHEEAIFIILPHCLEANMIQLDQYYGELLLPLAGADIFADTTRVQRGRKFIQVIRSMFSAYHEEFGIPCCLSEIGVKRPDFGNIAAICLNSRHTLYNPSEVTAEAVQNILNASF